MDKQVELALLKWPNVPHCYGWLGLDARGQWRMRDQQVQQQGGLGSKIANRTLRDFISRNYQCDDSGRYFFQNGPQRVYVELQATPHIAHADPQTGWTLHTGAAITACDAVWLTSEGNFILHAVDVCAQIDDRDLAQALLAIELNGTPASEQQLLDWLADPGPGLSFLIQGQRVAITPFSLATVPFVKNPQPDS